MKIYYSVSVRGGILSKDVVVQQINFLKKYGEVLTEHLASDRLEVVDMGLDDFAIYEKDMNLLKSADVVIADCTAVSLGVGYIIGKAESLGKQILCVSQQNPNSKISAMISGNKNLTKMLYGSITEFEFCVRQFLVSINKSPRIYLCGPPGSGKSTIAKKICEEFHLVNISTGQILREIASDPFDPTAVVLNSYISQGKLVPADLMSSIVFNKLTDPDCLKNGFVLDGYPPSKADLDNLINNNIDPDFVFYFECTDETAISRQCGRKQRITDTEEMARERMRIYHEGIPDYNVLCREWFKGVPVIRINAESTADKMYSLVEKVLFNFNNDNEKIQTGSYFPICSFDDKINSTRFHFHIDAPTHQDLLSVLFDVYVACPELHGQIKVHPIRKLSLGTQTKNLGVYNSMLNFHEITENSSEAFATGRLGDEFNPDLMKRVLFAVKNRRNKNIKVMVELEEYTDEWETCKNGSGLNLINLYDQINFDPESLSEYFWNLIEDIPPVELHLGFDIPKADPTENTPINLEFLNQKCTEMNFDNGGWFIFKNENFHLYRSNQFSHLNRDEARKVLLEQSYDLEYFINSIGVVPFNDKITISCGLEIVHGIWHFE